MSVLLSFVALIVVAQGRNVFTWVPGYGVSNSQEALQASWGGYKMADGLTHLALQFWRPSGPRIVYGNYLSSESYDDAVKWFADWGHRNGVKVMLCIYDVDSKGGWDWSTAQSAINPANRHDVIRDIMSIINQFGLDGVDINFEAFSDVGRTDRRNFVSFIKDLSAELLPAGLDLTVDTFSYIWGAPNADWWDYLFPYVTGINSMGYGELGARASGWRSYSTTKDLAGKNIHKVQMGMPGWMDDWMGDTALNQVNWILNDGNMGVAIWDAQLASSAWRRGAIWKALAEIKNS